MGDTMEKKVSLGTVVCLALVIGFVVLTVMDASTVLRYQTGPEHQAGQAAIGHLWNARRTLNLTLSGLEWKAASEALAPLHGNPQCENRAPWAVCSPDFDWDSMRASFWSTGDELIRTDAGNPDSFTRAQIIQNNQHYIDEAVEHVSEAGDYSWGWSNWNATVAGFAWFGLLALTVIAVLYKLNEYGGY